MPTLAAARRDPRTPIGAIVVWHAMSDADRFAFMFIEQVALELLGTIVVELPE